MAPWDLQPIAEGSKHMMVKHIDIHIWVLANIFLHHQIGAIRLYHQLSAQVSKGPQNEMEYLLKQENKN